jgi:hypothetical protein
MFKFMFTRMRQIVAPEIAPPTSIPPHLPSVTLFSEKSGFRIPNEHEREHEHEPTPALAHLALPDQHSRTEGLN